MHVLPLTGMKNLRQTAVFVDITRHHYRSMTLQSVQPNLQNIEPYTNNSQIKIKKLRISVEGKT